MGPIRIHSFEGHDAPTVFLPTERIDSNMAGGHWEIDLFRCAEFETWACQIMFVGPSGSGEVEVEWGNVAEGAGETSYAWVRQRARRLVAAYEYGFEEGVYAGLQAARHRILESLDRLEG